MIRPVLLLLLIVSGTFVCSAQASPLKSLNFEEGGYTLIGIFSHHDDHPVQKRIGEFYVDDISVLNAIKRAWVFTKPQIQHACGYHYIFVILKNGVTVASLAANLECKELVTASGSVVFDPTKLTAFASQLKPLKTETRRFASVGEAREFLDKKKLEMDFVYYWPPRWTRFEGEFRFQVPCPSDIGDKCYYTEESKRLLPRLTDAIAKKYPGEDFELTVSGGISTGEALVTVRTNRSLAETFELFNRWGRTGFGKWEAYEPSLSWYSRRR